MRERGQAIYARLAHMGDFAISLRDVTDEAQVLELELDNVHPLATLAAHPDVVELEAVGLTRRLQITIPPSGVTWVRGSLSTVCPSRFRIAALADVQTNPGQFARDRRAPPTRGRPGARGRRAARRGDPRRRSDRALARRGVRRVRAAARAREHPVRAHARQPRRLRSLAAGLSTNTSDPATTRSRCVAFASRSSTPARARSRTRSSRACPSCSIAAVRRTCSRPCTTRPTPS